MPDEIKCLPMPTFNSHTVVLAGSPEAVSGDPARVQYDPPAFILLLPIFKVILPLILKMVFIHYD